MTDDMTRAGYSVRGLANWILDYAATVGAHHTNMGLNKLVFFAVEGLLLGEGRLLTNAKIEAWEHGPVFRELYQSFKRFGDQPITGRAAFFSTVSGEMEEAAIDLSLEDAAAIRAGLAPLIHKSASELRGISHLPGSAWHKVWWYEGHANPGMEITPVLMLEAKGGTVEKPKTAQQRVDEMRRPPSLANWVRLNDRRRDETARKITRFVLAKPRHALSQVYRLIADYVTLGVSAATTRAGIDLILNPLVRRLGHEIATALIPWLDKNGISGIRAFDNMIERYPIGRKIMIPVRPTFVYNRDGKLTPVFVIGWSAIPLNGYQKRLLATMIHQAILTQEDFDGSDALILFVPRQRYSKTTREVREMWVSDAWLLNDEELRQQFDCYGNALDDAVPIILREMAAREGK